MTNDDITISVEAGQVTNAVPDAESVVCPKTLCLPFYAPINKN